MKIKKIILITALLIFTLVTSFVLFYKFIVLKDLKAKQNRATWHIEIDKGYAPYKFSVHKGWFPDKNYKYPVFRRKISKDLPPSNFSLQVEEITKIIPNKYVTIDNYILKDISQRNKATIISEKDIVINGIKAKDATSKYMLTYKETSREVFNRIVYFVRGDYIYKFELGTFEKDFNTANKEFELMVKSFRFARK